MNSQLERLTELLGTYKAEWLSGKIFQYFTEPTYFAKLKGHRPCVLQGGRGTGKTTVLRGLSYQGQYALNSQNINILDSQNFIGIYHRANTNHTRAFSGNILNEQQWQNLFGHYFNLLICKEITTFINWHKSKCPSDENLNKATCSLIADTLCINNDVKDSEDLQHHIERGIYSFQSSINNLNPEALPQTSMQGVPIQVITEKCTELAQFSNKIFYLLIDEYENYTDGQQQMINTLIKHNQENYTFKIGVRELGWRIKYTLNNNELLNDPADYTLINIEQKLAEKNRFNDFAKRVCIPRIRELIKDSITPDINVENVFPGIDIEKEARLLKVDDSHLIQLYDDLPNIPTQLHDKSSLFRFFLSYWANTHDIPLVEVVNEYMMDPSTWDRRYANYNYSLLFKIRKGRGKGGIQKYYAGWNTLIKLANGNIRYLLELVYTSFERHIEEGNDLAQPISIENQTLAAIEVGRKNLSELEGLWKNGAKITKLLMSIGRIYNVFAKDISSKLAPEITQFEIKNPISNDNIEILHAGVMNLAFVRMTANKLSAETDTKDYMYMIHPIFAPFFGYSFRKKRKMSFNNEEFSGLISDPEYYIHKILEDKRIKEFDDNEQYYQLLLFE